MKIKVKFSETGNIFAVKVQEEEKTFMAHFKDVVMVNSNVDLTGYATEEWVMDGYQPKGDYLTAVPDGYAKTEDIPTKPEDIGAQPSGNYALKTEIPFVPVQSVNGQTGAVQLSAADVKARSETWMPSAQDVGALPDTYIPPNQTSEQVGADPKGSAASAVSQHNTADDSHNDIRLEVKAINNRLAAFFDSDNQTLDELSEIVAYITNNKTLIDSITTSKVPVTDIINNLTTNVTNKPLSAAQGVVLKGLIDALSNSLLNYQPKGNYLTSFTETDPTVPSWAKASSKPSYSKSEVGLGNVDNVKQYSASNPPPYPVTSVNGETGDITVSVPTKVSQLQNDAGYLTQHQDISGKLDASALPTAIDTALAQAKASGEFDGKDGADGQPGKDGYTPQKGVDYFDGVNGSDGKDGYTPVKGKDYFDGTNGKDGTSATHSWNGTTLTITSASGTSSANLKGDKGDKGDSIKGDTGSPGADGVSPTVAVSKSGKVTTISITDKNGTKTATVNDGADGASGSNGKDGTSVTVKSVSESTEDGGSNVVTFSDGKTLTVKNGSKGSTGSAGKNGADGKTPVKGVDYFTPADQEEIVQQVITALGTPVFGRVDAEKNIILSTSGVLADGTYKLWFEGEDGKLAELCTYNHSNVPEPTYTNVLPLAINADGTQFVGTNGEDGYKTGYRLNSSGGETLQANIEVTGFIPAKVTDKFYFYDIDMTADSSKYNRIALYDASFTHLSYSDMLSLYSKKDEDQISNEGVSFDASGNLVSYSPLASRYWAGASIVEKTAYIRIASSNITDNSVVTRNEQKA